jgi:hypothetical protein
MIDKEEWTEVDTTSPEEEENKVEFEVEEEVKVQAKAEPEPEPKAEAKVETEIEKPVEEPQELDGIETKGAQKRIRQLIKQRKDRDDQISQLVQQNETLNTRLTSREQEFHNISKLNLDANEKQITDKLELARSAYASAHEEGDSGKILKAQEFLNEAQNDLKTLNVTKAQFKDVQPQAQPQYTQEQLQQYAKAQQQQQQSQVDPLAVEWAGKSENEWFGKDRVMTAAALALDADLKEQGFDPSDPEFYNEIDSKLKENFPHKFTTQESVQEQPSQPAQVVAGASRSTPSSNKKVKLTKEDVRLAQNWGIPLEQYAAEKLKVENADGEYTAIKT